MKVFKRLVSLCLTLLMLLGCLSGLTLDARAEETDLVTYDVWVLGTQVTEENREDVLGDGTVRYDSAAKTLYLDSLGTRSYDGEAAIDASGDLILELNGKTILNQSNYGLRVTGSLRVRGPGSLTTTGKDTGVYTNSLYLDDVENKTGLYANGYYYGIRAGELHLRQGTVNGMSFGYANETDDPVPAAGIYAFLGVVEIGSSTDPRFCRNNVTLSASGAQGAPAVYAYQGIQLSDAMEVTAPAAWSFSADGRTILDGDNPAAGIAISPKAPRNLLLYYPDEGGRLISDQHGGMAYPGQQITITAVPDADMYLNDLMIETVTDDGEPGETPFVTAKDGTYTFIMPDADVAVTADFSDWPFYDVAISETAHGTVTTPLLRQPEGETVELTVTPEEGGYVLQALTVTTASGETVEVAGSGSDWSFEMPAQDVTVSAVFGKPEFTVTIAPVEHGTVTAEQSTYHEGDPVRLTVTPDYGWYVKSFEVRRADGARIGDATTAGFTMPAINVTVTVTFDRGYPLWVGNTQVTDENAADILGNGQFRFEPATRTLTVNGSDAVNPSTFHSNAVVSAEMDFTLAGNGSLKSDKAFCQYGIYAKNHTVTVDAEDLQISGRFGGILAGEVVFAGGASSISATPSGVGVKTEGSGKVIFAAGITQVQITSGNSYPVSSAGRIDIDDCNEIRVPEGGMIFSVGNGYYFADADGNSESLRSVTVAAKQEYSISVQKTGYAARRSCAEYRPGASRRSCHGSVCSCER